MSLFPSALSGTRVVIDNRAPGRPRKSTCSEVFRAPVGWSVRLREAYRSMSFSICPIHSHPRSCLSFSNRKMGVLSGNSAGAEETAALGVLHTSIFRTRAGQGGFFPAPEAQLIELSQIIVHPDRALTAIDQSRNPLLHCITISRKNMFSEICVIWEWPLGCILPTWRERRSERLAVDGQKTQLRAKGGSSLGCCQSVHSRLSEPDLGFYMPEEDSQSECKEGRGEAELGRGSFDYTIENINFSAPVWILQKLCRLRPLFDVCWILLFNDA